MSFERAVQALRVGDDFEAEKQLRRIANANNDGDGDGSAEFSLGLLLGRQTRFEEAVEWLDRAVQLKTDPIQRGLCRQVLSDCLARIPGREDEAHRVKLIVTEERKELLLNK